MYCESDLYLFLPNLIIYTCTQVITEAFKKKSIFLFKQTENKQKTMILISPFLMPTCDD